MTAQQLLSAIGEGIYLALFAFAAIRLWRSPTMAAFDTFLFFGVIGSLLLVSNVVALLGISGTTVPSIITWVGVAALPYVLLRLADDFRPQPTALMVAAGALFAVVAAAGVLVEQPWPIGISLTLIAYASVVGSIATFAFLREARRSLGVTRHRMQAVALGSGLLALVILLAGAVIVLPSARPEIAVVNQVATISIAAAYYVGFAPPAWLRRAWQEPALRHLLAESADLVELADAHAIAERIERTALAATGADGAAVGLWDEASGRLQFRQPDGSLVAVEPGEAISGRAFGLQQTLISTNAGRDAPERATTYVASDIRAIVAAPITSGDRRLGVITVYAARPPVFSEDAVALVTMLAEQAALVLRSHELLLEAAEVRALAEMTRLKDDFLSVVAHDVRTPLTTILINAELLERTLAASGRESDTRRARSLRDEANRLKDLVEDYLDVVQTEQGRELRRERVALDELTREAVEHLPQAATRVRMKAEGPVIGSFDPSRIRQLVVNLLSNALKYSPHDGMVDVTVGTDAARREATITVADHGIGIPEADVPHLFERFHRGSNTDDRQYRGLGLGLYICHQVVVEHGGRIDVQTKVGEGTVFSVHLPLADAEPDS